MSRKTVYVHYTSPTDIECCVVAPSVSRAAKALATTPYTLEARGKVYRSTDQVPEKLHVAMALALERPERVVVREDDTWKALVGDPANSLLSAKQLSLRGTQNARIGDAPMEIHSVTCEAQTWYEFLELGGSKWFRQIVKAEYKKRAAKAK